MRLFLWSSGLVIVLAAAGYAAFQVSPWPGALLIKYTFERDAARVSEALARHVPAGVASQLNERYDDNDPDALLDVHYPSNVGSGRLPTIVWIHGGGWVSGSKEQIANYAKILAAKNHTVVGVDYSLAPAKTYPTPVRQVNAALAYLIKNAPRLHVDTTRIVLAGDSAGAHIAAQLANAISVPSYAKALGVVPAIDRLQLAGVILHCGPYDLAAVNATGPYADFLGTVRWSYTGVRDFKNDPRLAEFSVVNHVTPEFPPAFISAGNADPLLPQSVAFADALAARGVRVDRLFFPRDHTPPLPHEYQFNLDSDAGKLALDRTLKFLSTL